MTIFDKIHFMRHDRYLDLNYWEREFIADVWDDIEEMKDATDEELIAFLSERQLRKIDEIWEDLGL